MLKRYLIAGLLVWIPIVATIAVLRILLELVDGVLTLLPEAYQPQTLLGVNIPGLGLIIILIILMITGLFVRNYFGHRLIAYWEAMLSRIPLVRTIYNGVKQSMQVVLSTKGDSFRQVLLVQYPRKGLWSIGFLTNKCQTQQSSKPELLTLFIPTTPNPTSGFLILAKPEETIPLDLSVDQALKFVISLGTVMPAGWEQWARLIHGKPPLDPQPESQQTEDSPS